jgi:uncharacterized protein YeaO (DUF488 family)
MVLRTKRVYDPASPSDGRRYLVDRLWPRGRTKESLEIVEWTKEIAPSLELCRWYGHRPDRFPEFRKRYREELEGHPELVERLVRESNAGPVTLVFAARDAEHSNAAVLRELLDERRDGGDGTRRPGRKR